MRFDLLTLFPELLDRLLTVGVVGRAREQGVFSAKCWNPRDYAPDSYGSVDDRPFGGGPGMVLRCEPLSAALDAAIDDGGARPVIAMSPQGARFDQRLARELAAGSGCTLVCGRYEGIDQRFLDSRVDLALSIGDFVVSGGEMPAALIVDAVVRLLPGSLGHSESAAQDSFAEDGLLDAPHYTRPAAFEGVQAPELLLSGNHEQIARWRRHQALEATWRLRPDKLAAAQLSPHDKEYLQHIARSERRAAK